MKIKNNFYPFLQSLSILFCLFLGLTSCKQEESTLAKQICKKWNTISISKDGTSVKKVDSNDCLLITSGGDFNYSLKLEQVKANGKWTLIGDTLQFCYEPKDSIHGIDSLNYTSKGGNATIQYYNKGNFIGQNSKNGFFPNKLIRNYLITKITPTTLQFSENGVTYSYQYKALNDTSKGGFTLSGIINGLIGIAGLTLIGFLLSNNKKRINWRLIIKALILQFIFAFLVLKVPSFGIVFGSIAKGFVTILDFSKKGSTFLFGGLVSNTESFGFIFVFQVLPTIIFFAALTSALFYLNILQKVVFGVAWVMKRAMKLSGAESLASAANIFVGQTEAPLVIKPYISRMTKSETMALMTGGMAHISGGVLAAYIGFLGGSDPEAQRLFATHLLSASIMTAPGTFFAAKLMVPETEVFDTELKISKDKIGSNILDAIANGTGEGLKLAVNVAAMLLVFIAFITMFNYMTTNWIGNWTGLNDLIAKSTHGKVKELSLEYILGYVFSPLAWLIGIRGEDVGKVGQLLGTKVILNEFVAYIKFSDMKALFESRKDIIITTYALCGFANFASIGIQLGGIGSLAPDKRPMLASLGIKALIGGTIANLLSAAIAGIMV